MPSRLIEQHDGVCIGGDTVRDFGEVEAHRRGVAVGQDEGGALPLFGADGAEQIGRRGALVVRRRGAGAASGPASGDAVLLADPRFVLEPDLYALAAGGALRDLRQRGGEVFLNVSRLSGSCA